MENKIIQMLRDSGFTSRDGTWLAAPTSDVVRAVLAILPRCEAGGETVEQVARAIADELGEYFDGLPNFHLDPDKFCQKDFMRAAYRALSLSPSDGGEWDAAIEEAAKVAEHKLWGDAGKDLALVIRALKRPPVPQEDLGTSGSAD